MFEHDANDSISIRNAIRTVRGLLDGSRLLGAAGRNGGERADGLQTDVAEVTREYVAVEMWDPDGRFDEIKPLNDVFFGRTDRFVIRDGRERVSLPERTAALATPVAADVEDAGRATVYFRTGDVDLPKGSDDEVDLWLGAFTERTIPGTKWDEVDLNPGALPERTIPGTKWDGTDARSTTDSFS
jgi:hypothetical protein